MAKAMEATGGPAASAAIGGTGVAGPASLAWQPQHYSMDPYRLQVVSTGGTVLEDAVAASVEQPAGGDNGIAVKSKGRPGRKKRTSVLCQVRCW